MNAVTVLATSEIRDGLRNRWIAASIILLTALSLSLYFLGSAPTGSIKASSLSIAVVSLASLSVYLIPLMALMLSFDALVGEFERGTMLLLLTYPIKIQSHHFHSSGVRVFLKSKFFVTQLDQSTTLHDACLSY